MTENSFHLVFNLEVGEAGEMMKISRAVLFVLKLIGAPVLTQLGTSTKNCQYSVPVLQYKAN